MVAGRIITSFLLAIVTYPVFPAFGQPTDAPDLAEFQKTYRLEPKQLIRYIPRPYIVSRQAYWDSRNHKSEGEHAWLSDEMQFFFNVRSSSAPVDLKSGMTVVNRAPGLTQLCQDLRLFNTILSAPPDLVIEDPALEQITLDGDWIFKDIPSRAPAEQSAIRKSMLPQLEAILKEQTGKNLKFREKKIDREVIVVKGQYHFTPIDTAPDFIDITADPNASNNRKPTRGTVASMIRNLTTLTKHPFIDETKSSSEKLQFRIHPSAIVYRAKPLVAPDAMDTILKSLAQQTGLEFRTEKRATNVMTIVEE